jgi:23S rRNA pseudouridine1911/1915/1917 synthase
VWIGSELEGTYTNKYGVIPFFHCKNLELTGRNYGLSDLEDLIPLNMELNLKNSDVSEIIEYHSAPVTLVFGARIGQLEKGANKVWGGLPKDAKVENLALESDLQASKDYINSIKQAMHEIGGVPEGALGKDLAISNTSGVALQLMLMPLIERIKQKRALTAQCLSQVNKFIIKIGLTEGLIDGDLSKWQKGDRYLKDIYQNEIIFEDNHLLVVEKPPNMLSQSDSTGDADLLSTLKEDLKVRYNKPGEAYLGLVHRLDRPVGGVMVFAKTSKAASRLSEQIRVKSVNKSYFAIVNSIKQDIKDSDKLIHYIKKDVKINKVKIEEYPFSDAKQAVLYYCVVEKQRDLCLVKVELETGRTHQIRAQLAAAGMPLWGDQKYGSGKPGQQLALWSCNLKLQHPVTKEQMSFSTEPPLTLNPWSSFTYRSFHG